MRRIRNLLVLTRKEGVRRENPLMKVGDYFHSSIRTPELRKEADEVLEKEDPEQASYLKAPEGKRMPAKSAKQYGLMQAAAHGNLKSAVGPSPEVAREFINKTPAKKRKQFAKALKR